MVSPFSVKLTPGENRCQRAVVKGSHGLSGNSDPVVREKLRDSSGLYRIPVRSFSINRRAVVLKVKPWPAGQELATAFWFSSSRLELRGSSSCTPR